MVLTTLFVNFLNDLNFNRWFSFPVMKTWMSHGIVGCAKWVHVEHLYLLNVGPKRSLSEHLYNGETCLEGCIQIKRGCCQKVTEFNWIDLIIVCSTMSLSIRERETQTVSLYDPDLDKERRHTSVDVASISPFIVYPPLLSSPTQSPDLLHCRQTGLKSSGGGAW